MQFNSPWLQCNKSSWPSLNGDLICETAIMGGGISGVSTLFFLMTYTTKKVALFEKGSIASGATGQNAGLAISHIERPITELVKEFGLEMTKDAYDEIGAAWKVLFEINEKLNLKDNLFPLSSAGMGISSLSVLIDSLKGAQIQSECGRGNIKYWVSDDENIKRQIPKELNHLVHYVPREEILKILEVMDSSYIAVIVHQNFFMARMNSAKFCHEVLRYLQSEYPDRFSVYENTEIAQIDVDELEIVLHHSSGKVHAEDLILCTNGYKNFSLFDHQKKQPITKLHDALRPREGFLAAFPDENPKSMARGFSANTTYVNVPYWYISRGPLVNPSDGNYMCLGGPEFELHTLVSSELIDQYAEESIESMKQFYKNTYQQKLPPLTFFWHGMMGYTDNGLRWVGQDPEHSHLWYNLGCNGIGIIPSIAGAKRIARLMNNETLEPSVFDPPKCSSRMK